MPAGRPRIDNADADMLVLRMRRFIAFSYLPGCG